MSEHVLIDQLSIDLSGYKDATNVASLANSQVYGLKNCKSSWGAVMANFAIRRMFECTGAETLNQVEVDCLIGKLSENLALNCC